MLFRTACIKVHLDQLHRTALHTAVVAHYCCSYNSRSIDMVRATRVGRQSTPPATDY